MDIEADAPQAGGHGAPPMCRRRSCKAGSNNGKSSADAQLVAGLMETRQSIGGRPFDGRPACGVSCALH